MENLRCNRNLTCSVKKNIRKISLVKSRIWRSINPWSDL